MCREREARIGSLLTKKQSYSLRSLRALTSQSDPKLVECEDYSGWTGQSESAVEGDHFQKDSSGGGGVVKGSSKSTVVQCAVKSRSTCKEESTRLERALW